jgi:rare lipoprotein A
VPMLPPMSLDRPFATGILVILFAVSATGCGGTSVAPAGSSAEREAIRAPFHTQTGYASYYGSRHDGARTASGDHYSSKRLTAAHRTLPFGTLVRVTNLENERSVVVRINDRGPFVRGRIIDVSRRAAKELGFLRDGTAKVRIEVLGT